MDVSTICPAAPFAVFHRLGDGEGGYECRACGEYHCGTYTTTEVFAVALRHLEACQPLFSQCPVDGVAILDGRVNGLELRLRSWRVKVA